jgi:hypothetical protein
VTALEKIVGEGGIVWTYNDPTESKLATMISSAVSEPFMVLQILAICDHLQAALAYRKSELHFILMPNYA